MTSVDLTKYWMRGLCVASCLILAACGGSGSGGADEGPTVIQDPPDDDTDTTDPDTSPDEDTDDDDEDDDDTIADIVTDIVTTSVSVTTVTASGGS